MRLALRFLCNLRDCLVQTRVRVTVQTGDADRECPRESFRLVGERLITRREIYGTCSLINRHYVPIQETRLLHMRL